MSDYSRFNNPDKKYPFKFCKKWTDDEERLLIRELQENTTIEMIAENHQRTTGGIRARQKLIAYIMFMNNTPMEEIIQKTKLSSKTIEKAIEKKLEEITAKKAPKQNKENIAVMKKEIKELKQTIQEMKTMCTIERDIYVMKNNIQQLKQTSSEILKLLQSFVSIGYKN